MPGVDSANVLWELKPLNEQQSTVLHSMELLLHSLKPCPTQADMVWEPKEEECGLREEDLWGLPPNPGLKTQAGHTCEQKMLSD